MAKISFKYGAMNSGKSGDRYVFKGERVAIDGEEATSHSSLCVTCYTDEKAKTLA